MGLQGVGEREGRETVPHPISSHSTFGEPRGFS